jgi:hypothetical protein
VPSAYILLAVGLNALLSGCTTSIRDLSAGPVALRTAPPVGRLPERSVVSVTLRTRTDLQRVPADELIHADMFFCDTPSDLALLGRTIYVATAGVDSALVPLRDSVALPDASGAYTYFVLVEVARRASPSSKPPQIGFDLAANPRSVCIKLAGGYIGESISSNTVRVLEAELRAVFEESVAPVE